MKKWICTAIGMAVLIVVACSSDKNPAGPSAVAPISPSPFTQQTSQPPSNPSSPSTPEDTTAGHASWSDDGKIVTVDMTSALGYAENFGLSCYYGDMEDPSAQTLVEGGENKVVKAGDGKVLHAPLQCGVINQCDWYYDLDEPLKIPYYGDYRIAGKYIHGDKCPPPPEKCTPDPEPQCEYGPAIYNSKDCTYTCPPYECIQPDPPKCLYGPAIWDAVACEWSCPECESCVDSSESVSCTVLPGPATPTALPPGPQSYEINCDAYASHEGTFSLTVGQTNVMNKDFTGQKTFKHLVPCSDGDFTTKFFATVYNSDSSCDGIEPCGEDKDNGEIPKCDCTLIPCPPLHHRHAGDCKCWCDPVGEPECLNQVWDEATCSWIGECPVCELPPEQSFARRRPFGNPQAECAHFGPYIPGRPGDFFVKKCGKFYELHHSYPGTGQCSNGQDLSHITPCICPPID